MGASMSAFQSGEPLLNQYTPLGRIGRQTQRSPACIDNHAKCRTSYVHFTGMARAKTEKYVELAVHPRYKDNIDRYIQVVRAVSIQEKPTGSWSASHNAGWFW